MTVAATTELEAINIMLAAIGEAPINKLTDTLPVDARLAQSTLTEVSKEVQSEGWSFNTERSAQNPMCRRTLRQSKIQSVKRQIQIKEKISLFSRS